MGEDFAKIQNIEMDKGSFIKDTDGYSAVLGAYLLETALKLPPVFPFKLIEIRVLISVLVGVTAGVYPARKAARMNPVDALRYE